MAFLTIQKKVRIRPEQQKRLMDYKKMMIELSESEQKEAEDWRLKKCGKKGFNDLKRKFHKVLKEKGRFPEVKDENKALYTR